jgi:hypothetical protein
MAKKAGKKAPARKAAKKKVAPKGCCTIVFDDGREDQQIEGIDRAECTRRARAKGGTGQWNKGDCA